MGASNKIIGGVLKFETFANFPVSGKDDTLYLDEATNTLYHWDGSVYISITSSNENNRLRYIEFDANGDALESGFLLDANDQNDEAVYLTEEI
jgi:hypothetical protein